MGNSKNSRKNLLFQNSVSVSPNRTECTGNMFLESYGILGEVKAGSRKNYGTNDHMFNLRCLIDLFLFKKKKLFCAYRLQKGC